MMASALRRMTSVTTWGGTCLLFSLFLAAGNVVLALAILALLLVLLLFLAGPWFVSWLWMVGSPTLFGFANQFLSALPFVTAERLLFVMLLAMLYGRVTFRGERRVSFSPLEWLILGFIAYATLSLLVAATAETWRRDLWFLLQYAMPMSMYMVGRRIPQTEGSIRTLLISLTTAGVIMGVMGVLQTFFDVRLFDVMNVTAGHTERAYGTFSNAHTYVATLVVLLLLAVFQFDLYRDALARTVLLAAMAVMAAGIVLGQTRAPWGGAALGLWLVFLRERSVRPLLVTGGACAAVAGVVLLVLKFDDLDMFISRVTNISTMAERLTVWATAAAMIVDNPLFGLGFGADTFKLYKPDYLMGIGIISPNFGLYLAVPHNEYLHVAVLLGLLGLGGYLAILTGVLRTLFAVHSREAPTGSISGRLALYVAAGTVSLIFCGLLSDTHVQDYFWVLAYFLAGVVVGPGWGRAAEPARGVAGVRHAGAA